MLFLEILRLLLYFSFTLFLCSLVSLVLYARWHYGSLEKAGIPAVIKPWFIGGSDPFFYKSVCCYEDIKRVKKYGRVFGMYEGRAPQIFISDPDLIRTILIKDFDHFYNKRILDYGHPLINEMMDVLPYEKWKLVRPCISPQLTTGKIKAMSYQIMEAIGNWMEKLQEKMDNDDDGTYEFKPKSAFTSLTTDVIARCAFGTRINTFDDPNNVFVQNVRKLAFDDGDANILFTGTFTFPFMASLEPFISSDVMVFFENLLRSILQQRRDSLDSGKIGDFVDVMNSMMQKVQENDPTFQKLEITEDTVLCQAMIFLLAGFETTSTTMAIMSFLLSKHPEVQNKLLEEIDAYLGKYGGKISHETIGELSYALAIIQETLRLHPPLIRIERVCEKEWTHPTEGWKIPEGVTIQIPCFPVHYDPDLYRDPEAFIPERWTDPNNKPNPYTFLAFGQGPHNCIGMRFAKEEMLLMLASLLGKFRFEGVNEEGNDKLGIKKGRLFINNYEGFRVNLVKR